MLDIHFVRENPAAVRRDLKKRKQPEKLKWLEDLLKKDMQWRKLRAEIESQRHSRNLLTKEVMQLKSQKKDISKKVKETKGVAEKISKGEKEAEALKEKIDYYLMRIPNILDDSVPEGKDENDNKELRKWGMPKKPNFELKGHGELLQDLGLADFIRAAKVSGAGFNYLFGGMVMLDLALQRFAIDLLVKKGYKLIAPPLLMRRKPYESVTDLKDFESVMYKIENDDLYLIATSEHPLAAMYMDEILEELPQKFVGVSPCFRREIGAHGVDTRGLFRMHQFNKVEQFIFCKPEDSKKMHEELLANTEEIFKKLVIPYRIVDVCTGDIGTVASKKYDLEAWFPRENMYREAASCSNCTAYQATRLNIRYWKGKETNAVHTLNNTAIATSRAMRAILENYQTKNGTVKIPKVLHPYMGGIKELKPPKSKK